MGRDIGKKSDILYMNKGDGTFEDVTQRAGCSNAFGRSRVVNWVDYNSDGYLDIFIKNHKTSNVLYRNNKDGTFTDVARTAGIADAPGSVSSWCDYNNDSYTDLITAAPCILWENRSGGSFKDVTISACLGEIPLCTGMAFGDYNNDGYNDLFISAGFSLVEHSSGEWHEAADRCMLFKNNKDGTFSDVSDQAGISSGKINSQGAAWGDLDNDGYLDLYCVNSGSVFEDEPNLLYKNNGDGKFKNMINELRADPDVEGRGDGVSLVDYDNDGFLDIYLTNGWQKGTLSKKGQISTLVYGPHVLLKNKGNGNNWIEIILKGRATNRDAYGAKIILKSGKIEQYREKNGQGGEYYSQGNCPFHFGLGDSGLIDNIVIKWPSGMTQELARVKPNQVLTIIEPEKP